MTEDNTFQKLIEEFIQEELPKFPTKSTDGITLPQGSSAILLQRLAKFAAELGYKLKGPAPNDGFNLENRHMPSTTPLPGKDGLTLDY